MRKRSKPVPLDVEVIEPEEKVVALPRSVNARYVPLLNAEANGVSVAGLSGIPLEGAIGEALDEPLVLDLEENPHGLEEGSVVQLCCDAQRLMTEDSRFNWTNRMEEYVRTAFPGEVKLIDAEAGFVEFAVPALGVQVVRAWLPGCCLEPVPLDDGLPGYKSKSGSKTAGVVPSMLCRLRKDAKQVVSLSPYTWVPALDHVLAINEPGVLLKFHRRKNGCARVQFGGYLWSLPVKALRPYAGIENADSSAGCNETTVPIPEGETGQQASYRETYNKACVKYGCRPNSELLRLFAGAGDVRVIDLSNNYLGLKGMQCLASVLGVNHSITDLVLAQNSLCHDSVSIVIEALKHDRIVKRLVLSNNPLSYLTGRSIKQMLLVNPSIISVELTSTNIPEWMVHDIAELTTRNNDQCSG